ncbi:unnamed protein product [Adineta ricciae]|uniref:Uncharacterized protein n=1 Tax=Adineta ricciae TaxID=249248 RepID=A0A814Y7B0_ADIRI|nr:unnamed protein product [Adineta ricciae]CAF1225071.1 unnamed protein product [Adineta ricciae]
MISSNVDDEDYVDQLSRVVPWHRAFTFYERTLIVVLVITFLSFVGCILLYLIHWRSRSRRQYGSKTKFSNGLCMEKTLVLSELPSYESAVRTSNVIALNKPTKHQLSRSSRQSSYGTASESESVQTHYDGPLFTNGTQSSNGYLCPPFAKIHTELKFDPIKNVLMVHVINGENICAHPAFDEQAEYFIHVQLLNTKLLRKFYAIQSKHRSNLQLNTWKNQQEKTTRKLLRTADDKLTYNEYLSFEFNKDIAKSSCLRFLLFCIDRSGVQDIMFESVIDLNLSLIEPLEKPIVFKDLPQIPFGEIYLGISYLPTAERFTIKVGKLRYLFKTSQDEKIDARLMTTFFHRGHRFFHKKLSSPTFDGTSATNNSLHEVNEIITQNIPQNDIQSIYVHFELVIHQLNTNKQSIISCGTFLFGEFTRYESVWQRMIEQPRQIHFGWYQFFG